jgi:glycine cleavage system aminomethyltransferase T
LSVHASPDHRPTEFDSVLDHAGGVRVLRGDCPVVAHYGSAAGELAACVSAVGLADCSDLTKLLLHGPAAHLRQLSSRLAGTELAPGGAVHSGGVWWCAETAERLIVLCDPRLGARLHAVLDARVTRRIAVTLEDHSSDWAALAVVGRRARDLLAQLGVYGATGDPRRVPPLTAHAMTGADVLWLLESDRKALALVPRASAASVWRTIDQAGQPFGVCAVGQEALTRYGLSRRGADTL